MICTINLEFFCPTLLYMDTILSDSILEVAAKFQWLKNHHNSFVQQVFVLAHDRQLKPHEGFGGQHLKAEPTLNDSVFNVQDDMVFLLWVINHSDIKLLRTEYISLT